MRRPLTFVLHTMIGLVLAGMAAAAVSPAEPYGLRVKHDLIIGAPPQRVWAAIGRVGAWWNSGHTISGDAANLRLDLEPGGCFCERFPGGGGAHRMVVTVVEPGKFLTLSGALGPPEEEGAPSGRLMFTLAPSAGGTRLTVTFEGGGWATNGFKEWSAPVDRVLGEQSARLKRYVETGRPD